MVWIGLTWSFWCEIRANVAWDEIRTKMVFREIVGAFFGAFVPKYAAATPIRRHRYCFEPLFQTTPTQMSQTEKDDIERANALFLEYDVQLRVAAAQLGSTEDIMPILIMHCMWVNKLRWTPAEMTIVLEKNVAPAEIFRKDRLSDAARAMFDMPELWTSVRAAIILLRRLPSEAALDAMLKMNACLAEIVIAHGYRTPSSPSSPSAARPSLLLPALAPIIARFNAATVAPLPPPAAAATPAPEADLKAEPSGPRMAQIASGVNASNHFHRSGGADNAGCHFRGCTNCFPSSSLYRNINWKIYNKHAWQTFFCPEHGKAVSDRKSSALCASCGSLGSRLDPLSKQCRHYTGDFSATFCVSCFDLPHVMRQRDSYTRAPPLGQIAAQKRTAEAAAATDTEPTTAMCRRVKTAAETK